MRLVMLPKPGSMAQLEALVARLHAQPLDRSRPLWEYHLIEGVEGDRFAWYTKMHHACMDGAAGQVLLNIFGNTTSDDSPIGPSVADVAAPGLFELWAGAVASSVTQPLSNLRSLGQSLQSLMRLLRRALDGKSFGAYGQRAPRTRFNRAIGSHRTFTVGTLSLSELKAVGKAHDCSVNDVFMAVCAGGLRRYLIGMNELPDRPLIAGVPVSLRRTGDQSMSNQVTMLLTSLETHEADPVVRLTSIRNSARVGKAIVDATGRSMPQDVRMLGLPLAVQSTMASSELLRLGDTWSMPVNLVISNVAGPRGEVFIHGARMLTHYPVSVAAHGMALNITVQSYQDRMDFSLTACRDALADGAKLRDDMLSAWLELKGPAVPVVDIAETRSSSGPDYRSAA
jgi:diacylglycerol O-acyltransferase